MSPFSTLVFTTLGLFLTSQVEGPPFEDECDDSSFDAAFYNQSTLFILKNPYVYTWKRDSDLREGFSGKLKSKQHRYRYWPQIDDQITAACSVYSKRYKVQLYVFMNDQMMYFYADQFNKETQIWETFFWEHSLEAIENHEYFVPTCMVCTHPRIVTEDGEVYITAIIEFVNSDLTEIRLCKSTATYDKDSLMDEEPWIECKSVPAVRSFVINTVGDYLKQTQPCSHFVQRSGNLEPVLIFTGNQMIVPIEEKPLILQVDRTLFGCLEPPSFLFEFAIGFILWIIALMTTILPMLYFLLTKPRGDESRSQSKGKGQDDQVEVKESKDDRSILEPLSPLRQRIHLQRFRQPVGEEDTIRTIISTG